LMVFGSLEQSALQSCSTVAWINFQTDIPPRVAHACHIHADKASQEGLDIGSSRLSLLFPVFPGGAFAGRTITQERERMQIIIINFNVKIICT
jgi:hypothetical protein